MARRPVQDPDKKEYKVLTDPSEIKEVAGFKHPGKDKTIWLTDAQAEQPLRTGHLELKK